MANTPRTEAQLDALFLDNVSGDISAQDGRDFIATFFGHKSLVDPTANNDSVDSAGIGAFFSAGSRWLNTITQTEWTCFDGAPHLAVWQALQCSCTAPVILTPPSDAVSDILLRQHSATQTAPLLQVQTHAGTPFGASILGSGEFSNPNPSGGSGSGNELFGNGAGISLTTGTYNTIIGNVAGAALATGNTNTIVGALAAGVGSAFTNCTVVGFASGYHLNGGGDNTFVGYASGENCTTGGTNTFAGFQAGLNVSTGNDNVAFGSQALNTVSSQHGNVAIGANAAQAHVGSYSTFIGWGADSTGGPIYHSTAIGTGAICTLSNQIMLGTLSDTVYFPGHTSGILYSDISGAPSSAVNTMTNFSGSTPASGAQVTVFTQTSAKGLHGSCSVQNTDAANTMTVNVFYTDCFGTVHSLPPTNVGHGQKLYLFDLDAFGLSPVFTFPPITSVTVNLNSQVVGQTVAYNGYVSIVA